MPPLPVHARLEGFGQGGQAEAEFASQYVRSLPVWMWWGREQLRCVCARRYGGEGQGGEAGLGAERRHRGIVAGVADVFG